MRAKTSLALSSSSTSKIIVPRSIQQLETLRQVASSLGYAEKKVSPHAKPVQRRISGDQPDTTRRN
jgi:hypothetical protein